MAAPIQYDRRTFEQGHVESASEYLPLNSFMTPIETWLVPGYEGVLGDCGPNTEVETSIVSAPKIVSAIEVEDSSGNVLRVGHDLANGKVHVLDSDGALSTELKSGVSTTVHMAFVAYNDKILCFDGSTTPFQIVIATQAVSDIGLTQPDVTAGGGITTALTGGGSGNVKGTVKYFIAEITYPAAYPDDPAEGALSLAFGAIDAGDGDQVTITVPNNAEFNNKRYRIYRTYANREAPNYVDDIAVGASGGTYVDNILDEHLGDLPYLHGDPPPSGITAAAVHNDVLYGLAGNDLYFSDPGEEESWWTAADGNIIDLDRGDGDVGTALFVDSDGLVILKNRHMYKLLGSSPADYQVIPVVSSDAALPSIGTPAKRSICGIPGGAFFYYQSAYYVYSAGSVRRVSGSIERAFHSTGTYDASTAPPVSYDPRFNIVWVGHPVINTFNSRLGLNSGAAGVFVFDLGSGRWSGEGPVYRSTGNKQVPTYLLYLSSGGHMLSYSFHTGAPAARYRATKLIADTQLTSVTGSGVTSSDDAQFVLPRFSGGNPGPQKRFLWADVDAEGGAGSTVMSVAWSVDDSAFSSYETDTLDSGRNKYRYNIGELGREMDLKFKFDDGFRVFGVTVAYQVLGPSRSF